MNDAKNVLKFDAAAIAKNAALVAFAPPDNKRPLYRDLEPAAEFPMQAMGALRDAAEAIQMKTRAASAVCAHSVLAAAALVIAPHYDVELLNGKTPLTVLCLTVSESGERKSSVDKLALGPVKSKEISLEAEHAAALKYYQTDHAAWKAAAEHAKKAAKNGRAAARDALEAVGPEPKPPAPPMLLVDDVTPEAVALYLTEYRPYGGLFSDEGGKMLGGHAMSADSKTKTAALLNALWDGSPIRRIRVLTGTSFAPGRRFSMHLMVQPGLAQKLLSDTDFADIGLLARMLVVSPAGTAGTRFYREAPPECDAVLRKYKARILHFLDKTTRLREGGTGLDPLPLPLAPDARDMLVKFHDAVEAELAPGGSLSMLKPFASKMAEHAGRLAAVLAAFGNPEVGEVDAVAMSNGIELVRHYASEMKRLADGASISPDLKLAEQLKNWWQARSDRKCHVLEIYQRGPNSLRDAVTAKRIVAILEESGWVKRLPPGTLLDGAPRKDCWELAT